jgi:N-acetyl-gamma-glutamyl-phosphate/LysW-gamma-L-alpha-aminoadipyl-6-phosphate reductase
MPPLERAVVLGAGGFVGRELVRLLALHPHFELSAALSETHAGQPIGEVYPEVEGWTEGSFEPLASFDWGRLAEGAWTLFSSLGHGTTMESLPAVLNQVDENRVRVVDLSGDFRLQRPEAYREYYGREHSRPDWLGKFVYGLPEFQREKIRSARYVANPGCFATAAQLALLPLARFEASPRFVAIDGKTGSSGAGIRPLPTTHHPLRANNFRAYKPLEHQHFPEIQQGWDALGGDARTGISFVPQMTPLVRGIFVTIHAFYDEPIRPERLKEWISQLYAEEPFVRLVDPSPAVADVWGSNRCDVSSHTRGNCVVICSAIDNLVKGAAGQAIQNANLMCGWPETAGLLWPAPRPV